MPPCRGDLNLTTVHYLVGQLADLKAVISGPIQIEGAKYDWSPDGNVLFSFNSSTGQAVYLKADNYTGDAGSSHVGTEQSEIQFFLGKRATGFHMMGLPTRMCV